MDLKCCPCTDQCITSDGDPADVPQAFTIAPQVQVVNGVPLAVLLPVCYACRVKQLGPVSKAGLVTR